MILTEPLKHLGLTGDYHERHQAIDLGFSRNHGGMNPDILAMADGVVSHVYKTDTGGNIIVCRYESDGLWYYSVYKHCKKILKSDGDIIERGEPVAIMGKTGSAATGNHLHLELYITPCGTPYSTSSQFKDYVVIPYEHFCYNDDVHLKKETKDKFIPLSSLVLKKGDKVRIIGEGNSQASGKGRIAKGIGYERVIKQVLEGKPYPYKVGNALGTTGYYNRDSLELI